MSKVYEVEIKEQNYLKVPVLATAKPVKVEVEPREDVTKMTFETVECSKVYNRVQLIQDF